MRACVRSCLSGPVFLSPVASDARNGLLMSISDFWRISGMLGGFFASSSFSFFPLSLFLSLFFSLFSSSTPLCKNHGPLADLISPLPIPPSSAAHSYFSYFTYLTYTGLTAYYLVASAHTLAYALRVRAAVGAHASSSSRPGSKGAISYPLQRWPRVLQGMHVVLQATVTTFRAYFFLFCARGIKQWRSR